MTGWSGSRLAGFLARRFTPDRVRVYCVLLLALQLWMIYIDLYRPPAGETVREHALEVDFGAYYNAGRIANEFGFPRAYDAGLQDRLFHELMPAQPADKNLRFVYSPFLLPVLGAFARLPFGLAYLLWVCVSAGLYFGGINLLLRAAAGVKDHLTVYLLAASLPAFFYYCLRFGQSSTLALFALALAVYSERRARHFASGAAAALLTYKVPLCVVVVPMLVITKRYRALAGFAAGGAALAALSLALMGWEGSAAYARALLSFGADKLGAGTKSPTWIYYDVYTFLVCQSPAVALAYKAIKVAILVLAVPALFVCLRGLGRRVEAWAVAVTWTLLLNVYVPKYDAHLLIVPALLVADYLYRERGRLTLTFELTAAALFVLSLLSPAGAVVTGVQLITVVMLAFGFYQFRLFRAAEGEPAQARPRDAVLPQPSSRAPAGRGPD